MSITENNSSFPLLSFSFPSSNSPNSSNNLNNSNIKNNTLISTSNSSSSNSGILQGGQQGQGQQGGGGQIIQQIYEGQKFFWRQRLNVDINILYNRNENYIEVISYNSDLSIELNRIYISSNILYNLIQNDITNKVNEMKKDLSRDRFKKLPSDSELYLKVGDNLMSQFILNRLIAVNENNENIMKLSLLSADTFDLSTLVIEKNDTENQNDNIQIDTTLNSNSQPSSTSSSSSTTNTVTNQTKQNINTTETNNNNKNTNKEPLLPQKQTPVKINRRRKTTSGEFDRALVNLRQHSMELNEACDRASKLTELSSKSVDSFKYALSRHSVKYDKSKPLERFKWAVKRVILNNTVDRIRQQLEKRSKDKQPLRINATFPLPDGSIINPANAAAQLQRIPLLTKIHETYSTGPSPFQSPFVTPRGKGQKNSLNNSSSSPPPPSTINSTTTPSSISNTTTTTTTTNNNNNNSTSKGLLTKSTSINEMDTMPSVNQRQKSAGRILMASTSMPITPNEGNLSSPTNINTTTTSPTNQSSLHLPSLKDTHKTTTTNSNSGNQKDKKKTNKK